MNIAPRIIILARVVLVKVYNHWSSGGNGCRTNSHNILSTVRLARPLLVFNDKIMADIAMSTLTYIVLAVLIGTN